MTTALLPKTCKLISRSRLPHELADFAAWLSAGHYTPAVIHMHVSRLNRVLPRMPWAKDSGARGIADLERTFDVGRGLLSRTNGFLATRRAYARFLLAHGRLLRRKAVDPFGSLLQEYDHYLSELRGLSVSARYQHAHTIADFLARIVATRQRLRALTQRDVERFIWLRSREVSRHSMQHVVGHVRSFLRYCHERGYVASRLDNRIDTPRTYRGELPPRALPWKTVRALLASIDRRSKAGWRDYCILHLIAHYGLRPSEVASLRLDSIDWDNAVVRVTQHKTRSELLLPLAPATLSILRGYLVNDRDRQGSAHPELFLRARCPSGPLRRTAIGDIFDKRMQAAKLPDPAHGAYSLRHAFAMRLLGRGVGVKVIGDLLGHRSLDTTCTYLRLDAEALRGVALDVPRAGARSGGSHAHA